MGVRKTARVPAATSSNTMCATHFVYWSSALVLIGLLSLFLYLDLRRAVNSLSMCSVVCGMLWCCWDIFAHSVSRKSKKQNLLLIKVQQSLASWSTLFQNFEHRFHRKLSKVSYPFEVHLERENSSQRIGMQLLGKDGRLVVQGITPETLVHERNTALLKARSDLPLVVEGDILVKVNGQHSLAMMIEELASTQKDRFVFRFLRQAVHNKHYKLYEVDLERKNGEAWGMGLEDIEDFDGVRIARVVPGAVVSLWNRRAAQRGKKEATLYPGDWIIACRPALGAKGIYDALCNSNSVRLTVLRWVSLQEQPRSAAGFVDSSVEPQTSNATAPESVEEKGIELETFDSRKSSSDQAVGPSCSCCGVLCDKYILMQCTGGDTSYFRRECWRKKHGGFTMKHAPSVCHCGAPVSKLEVYERTSSCEDARLIHTIQDAPLVRERRGRAVSTSELEVGTARKRASSGKRPVPRTVPPADFDSDRAYDSPVQAQRHQSEDAAEEEPFFRPRRERHHKDSEQHRVVIVEPEPQDTNRSKPAAPAIGFAVENNLSTKQGKLTSSTQKATASPKEMVNRWRARVCSDAAADRDNSAIATATVDRITQQSKPIINIANGSSSGVGAGADPWASGESDPWSFALRGRAKTDPGIPSCAANADPWIGWSDPWSACVEKPVENSISNVDHQRIGVDSYSLACNGGAGSRGGVTNSSTSSFCQKGDKLTDQSWDPWQHGTDPWSEALGGSSFCQKGDKLTNLSWDPWQHGADPWWKALDGSAFCQKGGKLTDESWDPWQHGTDPWSKALDGSGAQTSVRHIPMPDFMCPPPGLEPLVPPPPGLAPELPDLHTCDGYGPPPGLTSPMDDMFTFPPPGLTCAELRGLHTCDV